MNTGAYSTGGPRPISSNDEQGFLKRYRQALIKTGLITILVGGFYTIATLATGAMITQHSNVFEHFNPRARYEEQERIREKIQKNDSLRKTVDTIDRVSEYARPFGAVIKAIVEFPWIKNGYVTPERYTEVRTKALEIAGIDERNPLHDKRRFELYRQLGFAVSRDEYGRRGTYISFQVWKQFIERNSTFRNPEWDQLHEPETNSGGKYNGQLLGKVSYKADSRAQGGNEDGVVDRLEWNKALTAMGYTTIDDLIEQIIEKVKTNLPELRIELEDTIKNIKKGDRIADADTIPPTRKLEAYLKQK